MVAGRLVVSRKGFFRQPFHVTSDLGALLE
jgi:hypothetical protein